jgi:hypothetical protein
MENNMPESFIVYHTATDEYFGVSTIAADPRDSTMWVYDPKYVIPWTARKLKILCNIPLHKTFGEDEEIIIVVPVDQNGPDFTRSVPITYWRDQQ